MIKTASALALKQYTITEEDVGATITVMVEPFLTSGRKTVKASASIKVPAKVTEATK